MSELTVTIGPMFSGKTNDIFDKMDSDSIIIKPEIDNRAESIYPVDISHSPYKINPEHPNCCNYGLTIISNHDEKINYCITFDQNLLQNDFLKDLYPIEIIPTQNSIEVNRLENQEIHLEDQISKEKNDRTNGLLVKFDEYSGKYKPFEPKKIFYDESHFLEAKNLEKFANGCKQRNIDLHLYGLNSDFRNEAIGYLSNLIPKATSIFFFKGKCRICHSPSTCTYRKPKLIISSGNLSKSNIIKLYTERNETATKYVPLAEDLSLASAVLIGGDNLYAPMCQKCYDVFFKYSLYE